MSDATTTLLKSWEEKTHSEDGFLVTSFSSGDPHTRAIFGAVRDRYNAITGRPQPTEDEVRELAGQKVTLVRAGENMIGGEMIVATEGTIFIGVSHGNPLAIKPKRNRTRGLRLDLTNVLDVIPGYSTAIAQGYVDEVRAHFPQVREITQERLLELPRSWDEQMITFCAFGEYRLPDCRATDAIVMFAEYDDVNDILDSGVVLVRPEFGVSEHGSMYGRDLLRFSMGEVIGFQPITFSEAVALCDLDFDEAFEQVMPRATVAA